MARSVEPIKLSAWQFAQHIGITVNKIKGILKQTNVRPVDGDLFLLRDLVRAYANPSGLKAKAEDARYQFQIDRARSERNKVLAFEREYVPLKEWQEMFADLQTKIVQTVRHSKLSQTEQDQLLRQIREAKIEEGK